MALGWSSQRLTKPAPTRLPILSSFSPLFPWLSHMTSFGLPHKWQPQDNWNSYMVGSGFHKLMSQETGMEASSLLSLGLESTSISIPLYSTGQAVTYRTYADSKGGEIDFTLWWRKVFSLREGRNWWGSSWRPAITVSSGLPFYCSCQACTWPRVHTMNICLINEWINEWIGKWNIRAVG